MKRFISNALAESIKLLVRRPDHLQVGALCYTYKKEKLQILLITSRGTGRWIIPKGWPMRGKHECLAAQQEAWEEAGVTSGEINSEMIGKYRSKKILPTGVGLNVETLVYCYEVSELSKEYPEKHQRKRKWFSPKQASKKVVEPELKRLILDFALEK